MTHSNIHSYSTLFAIINGITRFRRPSNIQVDKILTSPVNVVIYNGTILYPKLFLNEVKKLSKMHVGDEIIALDEHKTKMFKYQIIRIEYCLGISVFNRPEQLKLETTTPSNYIDEWNTKYPKNLWSDQIVTSAIDIKCI